MPAEIPALPVALVTGANRGIGKEVARQLQAAAFQVLLGARDLRKGEAAARELDPTGDQVIAVALDVADQGGVDAMSARVHGEIGRMDVLVNNAAILYDTWARPGSADLGEVHAAFETNLFGAWRVALSVLDLLRQSPHPRLVNVSSEAGSISQMGGGTPAYSASKAALNALTRLLAGELRSSRVLVNSVCPGWTATDMGGGGRPVAEGASSVVWAATLPDDGPTGGFFRDGRPLPW
jgi:NAD(P)-dependent dehydrogenase (short-subunit alcohol dehydrogenase family)